MTVSFDNGFRDAVTSPAAVGSTPSASGGTATTGGSWLYEPLLGPLFSRAIEGANGSPGVPVDFNYVTPAGQQSFITGLLWMVRDGGPGNAITCDKFGAQVALTNGLQLLMLDDTGAVIQDWDTINEPIKDNGEWGRFAGADEISAAAATGADCFVVEWLWNNSAGNDVLLPAGYTMRVRVQDNLLALGMVKIRAYVTGRQTR